jgi:hypothetical protein
LGSILAAAFVGDSDSLVAAVVRVDVIGDAVSRFVDTIATWHNRNRSAS